MGRGFTTALAEGQGAGGKNQPAKKVLYTPLRECTRPRGWRLPAGLLVLLGAISASAQGFLDWGNNFTGVARFPIYGPEPGNIALFLSGQSALGVPAGSTVYHGQLLQGTRYTFAVYVGAGTDPNNFNILVTTSFRTSADGGLPAGLVNGGTIQVPGIAPGSVVNFQIRAWDNGGTGMNWEEAVTSGRAFASSAVVTSAQLGGIGPNGPIINPSTIGWSSFNIFRPIPEPSTFVLGGFGTVIWWLARRRR